MTNYTPGYDRPIPKNLVEMAHDETGQWLKRDELETWVFRRFQRLEQQIKRLEEEHEAKVIQNAHLMRERDEYRAAEEHQIALRQKMEEDRDTLAAHAERLKEAASIPRLESWMRILEIINDWPATSLARRDALKQAEALESMAKTPFAIEPSEILAVAAEFRRQAEAQQ